MKLIFSLVCSVLTFSGSILARNVNVMEFGCKGDSITDNTAALQRSIDACAETGGGRVTIPQGIFLTGAVALRSNVELHLENGALLRGSTNHPEAYATGRGIIVAKGVENIAVTGLGQIDGQGDHPNFQRFGNNEGNRPHALFFEDCRNVTVRDIRIYNSAWWTFRLFRCDGVTIDGIKIYTYSIVNNDGIDVDARNVTISNCYIESEDDGICMKNDDPNFPVENITITNCVVASNCNPIKFGTSSFCAFRNITVSNCTIRRPSENHVWDWPAEYREVYKDRLTGLAGIAVESVVGAHINGLTFTNITMEGIITPIFVCLGARRGEPGTIRNLLFSNIYARAEGLIPCLISAVPGHIIEGITLRDIVVEQTGGGTEKDALAILPENKTGYPENRMYGKSNPAAGLYVRHAKNVTVDNFQVRTIKPDARPAVVMNDVQDAFINSLNATAPDSNQPMIRLRGCRNIEIARFRINGEKIPASLVGVEGTSTKGVIVKASTVVPEKSLIEYGQNVDKEAVRIIK